MMSFKAAFKLLLQYMYYALSLVCSPNSLSAACVVLLTIGAMFIILVVVNKDNMVRIIPTMLEYNEEFTKTGRYKETAENKPIFDIKAR